MIRGHSIKLTPIRRRQKREVYRDPDGIKIRIFDAFSRAFRHIDDELFDEHFRELGVELIKSTRPERCYENREVFNQNRFIVVKKKNEQGVEVDFGSRITVANTSFQLSYYGMQKYCGACRRKHGRNCPREARERLMKEMRKGETGKGKIYSDSTFRHVNQFAMTSDVACMTGGGIGQICNMIPFDEPHDEVVINAGTNELKTESLHEFVYTVDKADEKLRQIAKESSTMVVLPAPKTMTPETKVKTEYLHDKMKKNEAITTIILEDVELCDDMGHPTVEGTRSAVTQLHMAKGEKLVMNECLEDIVFPLKYRKVQTVFKVGCRGCDNLEYTPTLCTSCKDLAKAVDISQLEARIKTLKDEMFPIISDVVMMDQKGQKRSNSDNDDPANPTKTSRGEV